jgi:hypothetical protein
MRPPPAARVSLEVQPAVALGGVVTPQTIAWNHVSILTGNWSRNGPGVARTYRGIRWLDSDFELPKRYPEGKSQIPVRTEFVSSPAVRWDEFYYRAYNDLPNRIM